MKLAHFANSPSGKLIKVGQGEIAYWAFCPNPLPPALLLGLPLIKALSAADRALGELAGLGRNMSNPHLLIQPFIRREAVLSSRIEGTQADIADLYAYEAGQLPLPGFPMHASEPDIREVLNYVHALEYGLERIKTLPLSLRLFKEMHARLMEGVRGDHLTPGEFRLKQNWIGPPGVTLKDAAYVPPPKDEMDQALYALETYLHAEDDPYPPLIRIGMIHYQFEAIHPFLDGNGRIGRLLITMLLLHWNLLPLPLLYLSAYFERHRLQYYDLLMKVSMQGDWQAWLHFFLTGVAEQAQDGIQRAKQIEDLGQQWQSRLLENRSTLLMHNVVNLLLERPILSAVDVSEHFQVTHQTAISTLRHLLDLKIVEEMSNKQRNRRYVAKRILEIVQSTTIVNDD